ncbi:hypothetical protein TSA1_32960 [Bradyrhizobium nitroreducens]|uniref:Uncharacterized protein n=1 Tax=Bradyrhizobium nitroreducens TaxID=709803 RepID=A0A2M6UKH6_9BRAD|nr:MULTISPECIES: hypothetical protein [Bradyrhizobium]PIT05015.1 hypothetical protein TSA1_32960 [Bradyrhizobium nitroreducens]TQF41746.1 hypothetical protein UNPF46_07350 [Bradyrhizobium sp. UNPF46]
MSFVQTFQIVNNSTYTLYLDRIGSTNLGDGEWPATVAGNSKSPTFKQTGSSDINPTAVYNFQGTHIPINAYLHFYCVGVDPALHVNMTMQFSPPPVSIGSSISEDNTDNGHSYTTDTATTDHVPILRISTTGNGSSRGNAIFTIGP